MVRQTAGDLVLTIVTMNEHLPLILFIGISVLRFYDYIFWRYKVMCWYCNKPIHNDDKTITYRRKHRKPKYRTNITVHAKCYRSINAYKPRAHGSITQ